MAQLQNELAEKELIKKFRHDNSWLSELTAKNQWVNNDVIKIPRQGAAPNVLINNTVYPIVSNNRVDDFITLALNKYDTENTDVTDDELYSLPYEKVSDVQMQHREELEDKTASHALHSLSISAASANTPVLESTGPDDGTGRLRLITADLIRLWKQLADLGVPLQGRVIVLSTEHAADLMIEDSNRQKTWGSEWSSGNVPVTHAGFRLWVVVYSPRYLKVSTVWTKQAFEAITGRQASIVFYKKNACKATGSVKRYARMSDQDPENRKSTIGFRLWFIAVGVKDQGFAALVSADA
jgi:hypothetical protein